MRKALELRMAEGRLQKRIAELRKTRWLQGLLVVAGVAAVGLTIFIGGEKLFQWQPPPEFAQYTERMPDGVPLADFASNDSVESVTAQLRAQNHTPEHSSSHKSESRRYPPRKLDAIDVSAYRHEGQRGHLTLEFFNDRLYEVRFEPDDVKAYAPRLHASDSALKRDRIGMVELVRGAQRIVSNVDLANTKVGRELNTRPYVIWQDLRLKQQLAQWEETYGVESVRSED